MRTNTTILNSAASLLLASGLAAPAIADDLTVPGDYFTIAAAINFASSGDRIILAGQTYFENLTIDGKDLEIVGVGAGSTSIHGQNITNAIRLTGGATLTLRDLTVEFGRAVDGGGLLVSTGTSATVEDCVFSNNSATDDGGAVQVSGTLVASRTIFDQNTTDAGTGGEGGAMNTNDAVVVLDECVFTDNASRASGGAAQFFNTVITIDRSRFEGNSVGPGASAGAIYARSGSSGTITDTGFIDNIAGADGGAAYHNAAPVRYERCEFIGNRTEGPNGNDGGGVWATGETSAEMEFVNCLFAKNVAASSGAGLYLITGPDARVLNCSFIDNESLGVTGGAADGGAIFTTGNGAGTFIRNCLVRGNTPNQFNTTGNGVEYSNVEGGFAGADIVDLPVTLVDRAGGDYRLAVGSFSIDAGDTSLWANTGTGIVNPTSDNPVDLDGNARVLKDSDTSDTGRNTLGLAVDHGCYEFQPGPAAPDCLADVNGDGILDNGDINTFVQLFLAGCGG